LEQITIREAVSRSSFQQSLHPLG